MTTGTDIAAAWALVERGQADAALHGESSTGRAGEPVWLRQLAAAHQSQLEMRGLDHAAKLVAEAQADADDHDARAMARIVAWRIESRTAQGPQIDAMIDQVRNWLAEAPAPHPATAARAHHLIGDLCRFTGRLLDAERALAKALQGVGDAPARLWVLDGFGQVFQGQGAWEEARRTYHAAIELKQRAGDRLGVAITAGNLALMEIKLGRPGDAEPILRDVMAAHGAQLPGPTLVRLNALLVEALDEAGKLDDARKAAAHLHKLLHEHADLRHHVRGFAALTLARLAARDGDADRAGRWFDEAESLLTLHAQRALCRYWRAKLLPKQTGLTDDAAWRTWLNRMQALFDQCPTVCEAEVLTHLLMAVRAADGRDTARIHEHLNRAGDLATSANNPLLAKGVDEVYNRLDPHGGMRRMIERFTGRAADVLERTRREAVTIIFSDLAEFTRRSNALSPEQVMSTVRSLFELSVSLMVDYRVRPMQYLGDGLLAVCEGDDHERRGMGFAMELARKTRRVSLVRRAIGDDWGMEVRCGVASGEVVMGLLGSHFKREFASIGVTTNLAARLQGSAQPGQVVCHFASGFQPPGGQVEQLQLKGFARAVGATRLVIDE